ncbi:MAG TPA: ATP-dependent DNA helicase [Saprospiraceae bacterium]|nr:ATP-dependent DNA helicase [Saprospiraceae bacterium]
MTFEEKLIKLNPAQRSAVESIEGPVMVIAGPGTGKTEILSLRIGYILKNTDTSPGNILCLTYTDAAASEMRQRLISFIGPEAYKIQVNTFHSFCNLVIQENPSYFQQARELEPISEIDKFKLLQELIDSFGPDHPLKKFKGQMYYDWKRLDELFATMKKENWTPEYVFAQINKFIEEKSQDKEYIYQNNKAGVYSKGEQKPKFKTDVLDRMETFRSAVAEFSHYNALLAERGQYDFDDMLLWVYDAFKLKPDLLANYQERFLYFLVDEFQDTNGIQIDILQLMIDHEWIDRPNVFVVGDDDQAIYRFQGANLKNLFDFNDKYHPEIIFLNRNYRSSQLIIDASGVIARSVDKPQMEEVFGQKKTFIASGVHAAHHEKVVIQSFPTLSSENADIFRQLKTWHDAGAEGEIAVLYSKHELGRELAQALKGAGIPFHTVKTVDALTQPLILHLLEIIQCIHQLSDGADNDDALLYRILHLRYLHPNTIDLQKIILAYTSKEREDTSTLFMCLGNPALLDTLHLKDRKRVDELFQLIEQSIVEYHSRTLLSFVEWVIHNYNVMSWILSQEEKFTLLYTLKTFYSFVERESAGKSTFKVPDLLEICELMTTYNIRLPVQELAHANKGIHLSSLHGAKGLEFEKVIIKNITENEWEKKRPFSNTFSYPDNLNRRDSITEFLESGLDNDDQDRRRLLYVGMTRAKKELVMTYASSKDDGKKLTPSVYLTEIIQADPDIIVANNSTNQEILAEYLANLMSGEQRADIHKDDAVIRERVKNYVLNVSALNTYLECPVRFYYEKMLVIPSSETAPLLFGTALHDALQRYFWKRFSEKDLAAGKDYLTGSFTRFMKRNAHRFTQKELADLNHYGRKILEQFYDRYSPKWSDEVTYELEYKIKDVHIGGVPVKGFIDRLDKDATGISVYDYKSGRPDSIPQKLNRPNDADPLGGHYWRQMVFYDLLLRNDPRIKKGMNQGIIQAIEPKKDGTLIEKHVIVTDEDRAIVTNQILDTWQKIQNMEFETGCGECDWCRMHDLNPPIPEKDEDSQD